MPGRRTVSRRFGSFRTVASVLWPEKRAKALSSQSELLIIGLSEPQVDMSRQLGAEELASHFFRASQEVWLEIGFGAGEHLDLAGGGNPHAGLIGAEPYVNGVVAALSALKARHLGGRVKIHPDDAISLLGWLPEASLSRAFVLFPDPWPKKRHRERRIFSPVLLDKLGRVLRSGAELRFASDSRGLRGVCHRARERPSRFRGHGDCYLCKSRDAFRLARDALRRKGEQTGPLIHIHLHAPAHLTRPRVLVLESASALIRDPRQAPASETIPDNAFGVARMTPKSSAGFLPHPILLVLARC